MTVAEIVNAWNAIAANAPFHTLSMELQEYVIRFADHITPKAA